MYGSMYQTHIFSVMKTTSPQYIQFHISILRTSWILSLMFLTAYQIRFRFAREQLAGMDIVHLLLLNTTNDYFYNIYEKPTYKSLIPDNFDVSKIIVPLVSTYPVPLFPSGVAHTKCVKYGGLYAASMNIIRLSTPIYAVRMTPWQETTLFAARTLKFVKLTTGSFVYSMSFLLFSL